MSSLATVKGHKACHASCSRCLVFVMDQVENVSELSELLKHYCQLQQAGRARGEGLKWTPRSVPSVCEFETVGGCWIYLK